MAISLVAGSARDQGDEPPTAAGVEVGGRLVEDEDRRVAGEDARQAGPLPLAEAQVVRRPVGGVGQVDPGQAVERDPPGLGARLAQVQRAEGDVLEHASC